MTILTEPTATGAKYVIRAIALIAHPSKGTSAADLLLENNGVPLGGRIRQLVAANLGSDWTVEQWFPATGEF